MQLKPGQHLTILDLGDQLQIYQGVGEQLQPKPRTHKPITDLHIPADTTLHYLLNWQQTTVDRHLTLHLDQPNSHAELLGLFQIAQQHSITLHSTIAHHAPNTTGNCLIKGVLQDQSQASLSGMIQIDHPANNSYDQLTERLLILSPDAVGQLQPELEILTNDVKASHATTIARPDPEQYFYLQSRGVSPTTTQQLLITGFYQEVLDLFPQALQ